MFLKLPDATSDRPDIGDRSPVFKLLQSAACFAEFARLAGTWSTTGIEEVIDNRGPARREETGVRRPGSNIYNRYLNGDIPGPRKIKATVAKYPKTELPEWSRHFLGQLICDPYLDFSHVNHVVTELRALEFADKHRLHYLLYDPSEIDITHSNLRYPFSRKVMEFIYLLATVRIFRKDEEAIINREMRLFDAIPDAIARSPHLYLARDVLLACLREFLQWPMQHFDSEPFVLQERYTDEHWLDLKNKIIHAQFVSRFIGVNLPEERLVQKYTEQLGELTKPLLR